MSGNKIFHCVANFETLAIAKRYGVDAQRMREVLLKCPGGNGTLRRWDSTRFTWQEKDMDVTMDLAQQAGLVLPLAGVTDQLVKLLSAKDVKALLYGGERSYLGRDITPMNVEEGGLGSRRALAEVRERARANQPRRRQGRTDPRAHLKAKASARLRG